MFDLMSPMIKTLLSGRRPDCGVLPEGSLPLAVATFTHQGCMGHFPY